MSWIRKIAGSFFLIVLHFNAAAQQLVVYPAPVADTDEMPSKPKWYKTSDMANIFVGEHVEGVEFKK
jgi:hypothetical protein